jgi:filamentous hemagglutinin family protein
MKSTIGKTSASTSWGMALLAGGVVSLIPARAIAQIIPDVTLPNNSRVILGCSDCTIEGGTIRGKVLFHSFDQFSIKQNGVARFNNDPDVASIVTRVTGTQPSIIDGLIKVRGNTNFFLVNPQGFTFKSNAKLEIGGSFLASTASSFLFPNGEQFSAITPAGLPILSMDVTAPIGLRFEGNVKPIQVDKSTLVLSSGKNVALIGGEMNLTGEKSASGELASGELTSKSGRIELAAVSGIGNVEVGENLMTGISESMSRADIKLSEFKINGSNITLTSGLLSLNESALLTEKTASGNLGNILLHASGKILLDKRSFLFTGVPRYNTGNAGSITIKSSSLEVNGESEINSSQSGKGAAGDVFLDVSGNVFFQGKSKIFSTVSEGSQGKSGNITIHAGSLDVWGASQINSASSGIGDAGNIALKVDGLTWLDGTEPVQRAGKSQLEHTALLASVESMGVGNTGNINIDTGSLRTSNGADIFNGNSGDSVKPGNITIVSRNRIDMLNGSGIRAGVTRGGKGKSAGNIDITAPSVLIEDGAQIEIRISGTAKETSGIFIKASDSVTIDGRKNPGAETGVITDVEKNGLGGAGGIEIQTPKLILQDNGRITASTASGDGGNVNLKDIRLLLLRRNSQISATVKQANGNGGNISIDAPNGFVVAVPSERSFITANALLDAGGKVTINAKAIFGLARPSRADLVKYFRDGLGKKLEDVKSEELNSLISISAITAVSQKDAALDGQVTLNAPINPNQGVNQTPREPRSTVVSDSCQVSNGKESVRFFDIGRGGLPPRPEDPLSVDLLEWTSLPEARIIPKPSASDKFSQSSGFFPNRSVALRLVPPCQSR